MPADGLTLAVGVGRKIDIFAFLCRVAELIDDFFLSRKRQILRLKVMLDIHAHRAFRQVAQMTHTGLDQIIRPQILSDCLCL